MWDTEFPTNLSRRHNDKQQYLTQCFTKQDAREPLNCMFDQWIVYFHEPSKWIRLPLCERENRSIDWNATMKTGKVYMPNTVVKLLKHWSRSVLRWKSVCVCVWMQSSSLRDWHALRDALESINTETETHRLQIFHPAARRRVWNHSSNIQHDKQPETRSLLNECDWSVGFIKTQREFGKARFFQTLCIMDIIWYDWCYRSQLFKWDASSLIYHSQNQGCRFGVGSVGDITADNRHWS